MNMMIINDRKVSQVCCLHCHRRWIAARPMDVRLEDLECPTCGKQGEAIETGEICVAEELLRQATEE